MGRFISEDPMGFAGGDVNLFAYVDSVGKPFIGTNLYIYASHDPINRIDPYGLKDWGMIGGGAITVANGLFVSGVGGVLVYIGVGEAASIIAAPLAIHTMGLGGTLVAGGLLNVVTGVDLMIKGAMDNDYPYK